MSPTTRAAGIASACMVALMIGCGGAGSTVNDGGFDAQQTCEECVGAEPQEDTGVPDAGADTGADAGGCPESFDLCPYPDGGPRSGTLCSASDLYRYTCYQPAGCHDMATLVLVDECPAGCHDDRDGQARCMDPVTSCPVVAEGTAIFAFEALPGSDEFRPSRSFSGTPALGVDGTIYIGDQGARFYALNCDGSQKWVWWCNCNALAFEGSPAIGTDGTIYIGDDIWFPDFLFALDPRGKLKWQYESGGVYGGMDNSPVLGDDGTIYIGQSSYSDGGASGFVLALDTDGAMKAGFPIATGAVVASMAWADGRLFVASMQEDYTNPIPLRAIAPDGTVLWEMALEFDGSSIAVGANGVVYLTMNDYHLDENHNWVSGSYLASFDPATGRKLWEIQVSSTSNAAHSINFGVPASPVVGTGDGGDEIYVALRDGRLVKVVVIAGFPTITFDLSFGYIMGGAPALGDDGYIYAVAREGTEKNSTGTSVYKVSRDGSEVKEITFGITEMPSTSLTIAPGGALLFGTEEGKIIAVQTGATGLDTNAPWPTFRHDTRNTGNASTK